VANVLDGFWQIIGADGETWDWAEPDGGITRIAGIGLPPVRRAAVRTPTKDGSASLGFVLDDREVVVGLKWNAYGTLAARRRRKPYKTLNYLNSPYTLRRTLDDITTWELRQLDLAGGLELDSAQAFDDAEYSVARFVCRDPAWYDLYANSEAIEWDDLTHYYAYADYGTFYVATAGDWYAYPTIYIYGQCSYFEIQNLTTGQVLRYYGNIPLNDRVTLVCNPHPAYLSATNLAGEDVENYIYPDDDFGGFRIQPGVTNELFVDAVFTDTWAKGDVEPGALITWEDRYQGA